MMIGEHDPSCTYPVGAPCTRFSTDGTALGAAIAHQMGTTDEEEIIEIGRTSLDAKKHLTGMDEEQADWDDCDNDRFCPSCPIGCEDCRWDTSTCDCPDHSDDEACWTCSGRGCPECAELGV